jgi:TRAP-type uncharacterized transport system fused permease subunit
MRERHKQTTEEEYQEQMCYERKITTEIIFSSFIEIVLSFLFSFIYFVCLLEKEKRKRFQNQPNDLFLGELFTMYTIFCWKYQ